jgi:hypothetical protein
VASYPLRYLGTDIVLIDTPGFDDTNKSDSEVLRILYTWLKTNYANGRKLNAIFYLHNITDKSMRGSSLSNLHAFKRLCGDGFFTSVLLGTTFWRDVSLLDTAEAVAREWELKSTDDFWKKMISGGATARSIPDTRADALKLLMQMAGKKARVLQVQSEAIDQGRSFEATTAHQALNERLAAARTQHTLEVNRLAAQSKRAREAREREAARVAETLRQRQQEERRELQRQEEAQREAAEAHRLRMAALREEQDLAEAREKELERAMQKLKIEDTRNEKRAKFKRRTDAQMYLLGNSSVNPEIFRSMVTAYVLICDNCFENIGVGRYYREFFPP